MVCRGPILCVVGPTAHASKGVASYGVCLQRTPFHIPITGDLDILDHTRFYMSNHFLDRALHSLLGNMQGSFPPFIFLY